MLITPGAVKGTVQGGCELHPCDPGHSCEYTNYSLSCHHCTAFTHSSDGIMCIACPEGTGPSADRSTCTPCKGNNHSLSGVCVPCPLTLVPDEHNVECVQCDPRQTAVVPHGTDRDGSETRRVCGCADGFTNATASYTICFDAQGYDQQHIDASWVAYMEEVSSNDCRKCTSDNAGQRCLDCSTGNDASTLAAGFTVPQLGDSRRMLQETRTTSVAFRCHQEWDLAVVRCPANPSRPGLCTEGYTGFLCQSCAHGYGMAPSRACEPCGNTRASGTAVLVLTAAAAIAALCFGTSKLWPLLPGKHLVRCAFVPLRILVTYGQVVSQLGEVLSFPYPPLFNGVVNVIRPVIVRPPTTTLVTRVHTFCTNLNLL